MNPFKVWTLFSIFKSVWSFVEVKAELNQIEQETCWEVLIYSFEHTRIIILKNPRGSIILHSLTFFHYSALLSVEIHLTKQVYNIQYVSYISFCWQFDS